MSILEYLKIGAVAAILAYGVSLKIDNMSMEKQLAIIEANHKAQVQIVEDENKRLQQNLKDIENAQVEALNNAAANAVINYRAAFPERLCVRPVIVPMSGQTESNAGNDATSEKSLVTDAAFIRACADDAAILGIWQRWATINGIIIQE